MLMLGLLALLAGFGEIKLALLLTNAMIMLLIVLLIITAEKLIRRTLKLLILIIWGKMSFDKLQMLISNGLWF